MDAPGELGTIAVGKAADLVPLEASTLGDVSSAP
jgi:imidazolonepropionase-like amidohydrolase